MHVENFKGYNKIQEDTSKRNTKKFPKTNWVVTEKCHGANFCFITNGKTILCAKRKSILGEDEDFFNHKEILKKNYEKILEACKLVQKIFPNLGKIYIYGEIFGGLYKHEKVKQENTQPVQTGVQYCPHIEFMAFDIAYEIDGQSEKYQKYLNYNQSLDIFHKIGLFCAEPLFIGSYGACLDFNIHFDSTIPSKLGLPPLPKGTNKAEGVVIKPIEPFYIETNKGMERVILKLKIPEFKEDKRFHESKKWEEKNPIKFNLTNMEIIMYELDALCCENRLCNAISKFGILKQGDTEGAKKLLKMIMDDILEEIENNCEKEYKNLKNEEIKKIKEELKKKCKNVMLDNFKLIWKKNKK